MKSRPERYDLIWFVAPDSYAAMNAATSGAFVLSKRYLYTTEMIVDALEHRNADEALAVLLEHLHKSDYPIGASEGRR